MRVKGYRTQREYREFPLSDESEEDTEEWHIFSQTNHQASQHLWFKVIMIHINFQ